MADYNTLTTPQKVQGAMPGYLNYLGIPNPLTGSEDWIITNGTITRGMAELEEDIRAVPAFARSRGVGLNQVLNIQDYPTIARNVAPYIPPGYIITTFRLQDIIDVERGIIGQLERIVGTTNRRGETGIIFEGIPNPETDTTPVVPVPVKEPPIVDDEPDEGDNFVDPTIVPNPQPQITPTNFDDGTQSFDDGTQSGQDPTLSSLKDSLLGAFLSDVYLRDYTHAAKTFIPNKFSNAPKVKFLFHTYFNINADAWTPPAGVASNNYGILVKSVKLPSFRFETDTLNQYNRKRIIQSKIKYEPVDFTFHDDNASQITAMWNAYYQYYYADSFNPELGSGDTKTYNRRNIYDPSLSGDMQYGYRGDSFTGQQERPSFFKDITVYGLWNNQYVAYTFINPIITNWSGDTYAYDQPDGTMQHSMTIDYETVTHNTGEFNLEEDGPKGIDAVTGFGQEAYYDYTDSPNEQLGQGVGGLGGASAQMAILNDPNATAFEKAQALAKLSQLDPSAVIAQAKDAVKDGIKDAVKDAVIDKLTGGLFGNGSGSGTPTMGASPALIQISNQGGATAANNNNTTGSGNTAGKQNFGDSVVSNIARNLGFG